MTTDQLAVSVRLARRNVERAKIAFYSRVPGATYEQMEEAAKGLSEAMYAYTKAAYPKKRPVRIPFQAILR
jgi:hypothetical protein